MDNEEPKRAVTHVLVVVDMSGSMGPLAPDVRGGFNQFVESLRDDDQRDYRLTVTLFDTEFISLAVDAPLAEVPELTGANYRPRGMTALNDAIGKTIAEFDAKHGDLGDGEHVLMVVHTDGEENSSREFHTGLVKRMIADREGSGRWGFVFLGDGPDAWHAGRAYGMGHTTVTTRHSGEGTRSTYEGLAAATKGYSRGASTAETVALLESTPGVVDPDAKG